MIASHVLIAGAGPGGGAAAKALRERGFVGRITLVGRDPHPPYLRPALSKQFLRGETDLAGVLLDPDTWFEDHGIATRFGARVAEIDPATGAGRLDDGEEIPSDLVVLATGSIPRTLPLAGARLGGVHTLRDLGDSARLRDALAGGDRRLVIVGSGWIGMEVAASARLLGNDVTVLMQDPVPLAGVLGPVVGARFAQLHEEHGVHLRPGVELREFVGRSGTVAGVRLGNGEMVPADLVLLGVGAAPDLRLAELAGLDIGDGVLVDDRMRSSSERVLAIGDIAAVLHPIAGVRIRSEHFSNALRGGVVAADAILGGDARYDDVPTFLSAQYDVKVQFAGYPPLMRGAELVLSGDLESGSFTILWLAGGRPVAGVAVADPASAATLADRIRRGSSLDGDRTGRPVVAAEQR